MAACCAPRLIDIQFNSFESEIITREAGCLGLEMKGFINILCKPFESIGQSLHRYLTPFKRGIEKQQPLGVFWLHQIAEKKTFDF